MQPNLTDQQHQAVALLASGEQVRCVAAALGIRRETLWRWRQLPEFAQALEERRQLLHHEMSEQMQEIMRLALLSVERELKPAEDKARVNPYTTALEVLKLFRALPLSSPLGGSASTQAGITHPISP